MTDFLTYLIRGVPIGCVYALMAVGLVLTYKTSGVFNLAYGAQAYVAAVIFYELRIRNDWGVLASALIAIVIAGPLVGAVLDRALFRYLRTSTPLARLVTTLGLLVAVPAAVQIFVGVNALQSPPGLAPGISHGPLIGTNPPVYHFASFYWDQNQVFTIVATVLVAGGLAAMFRWSSIGLGMRAVAESPRMTQLNGVDAERVATVSWMLSGLLAALTGVLVAPLFTQVVPTFYFSLLVAAIAATVFGGLSSIPLTFLGGLLLGFIEQLFSGYLPHNSVLFTGLRPSLPFAVLLLLLLFRPGLRRRAAADPLAGVAPPPPAPATTIRPRWATIGTRALAVAALITMVMLAMFVADAVWLGRLTDGVIYSIIFLSITVVVGMAGQISLAQAAFAGVGAFTVGQLVTQQHMSVLVAIVIGALVSAVVGGLIAIPALRLSGVYVALATLAFSLLFDNVLVPLNWVGGGTEAKQVPRPVVGPFSMAYPAHDRAFFILCLIVLGIAGTAVWLLLRGSTGGYLDAVRASEPAAMSVGINPVRAKITAFAVSGALAGLGGGLLATAHFAANPTDFVYLYSLFWVLILVTIGSRSVFAAISGGFSFAVFPEIVHLLGIGNELLWTQVLFGLAIMTYVKYPEGLQESNTRAVMVGINRLVEWRQKKPAALAGEPA